MPWYKDPTIVGFVGAIVGALITSAVSIYLWRKSSRRKRVDCAVGDPTSLLSISDTIKEKLDVTFEGRPVSSAFLFPLEVVNSGSAAISQQPVLIRLPEGSKIVDWRIETDPEIGFGEITSIKSEERWLKLGITLLNPGDRVRIEILSIDNPSADIDIGLKNEDVESRVFSRRSVEKALAGVPKDFSLNVLALLSVVPFFGSIARALATLEIARRIDRIREQKPDQSL